MIAYLIPASCNGLMKMMKDDRDLAKRWMTCSISGCDERDYRSCNKDATKYPIVALLHPFHQHVPYVTLPSYYASRSIRTFTCRFFVLVNKGEPPYYMLSNFEYRGTFPRRGKTFTIILTRVLMKAYFFSKSSSPLHKNTHNTISKPCPNGQVLARVQLGSYRQSEEA